MKTRSDVIGAASFGGAATGRAHVAIASWVIVMLPWLILIALLLSTQSAVAQAEVDLTHRILELEDQGRARPAE